MKIVEVLRKNRLLIAVYFLFLIIGTLVLFVYKKMEINLFINQMNTPFFDIFFKYITELGAFIVIAPIILFQIFIRFRFALILSASAIIATVVAQILKRLVWYNSPRPILLFEKVHPLHFVDGVHVHSMHSFPSGHTTGAFALFVALALLNKHSYLKILFIILAILVAYSRIYLSQHFLVDVVVGSAVGTLSAFICYFWFNNRFFSEKSGLDRSLKIRVEKFKSQH
jgi:membrane-associated phospholipid phosphatase